jgi:hypothetical protein
VKSLPGLVLWVEATVGVNTINQSNAVASWSDQSGKGDDLAAGGPPSPPPTYSPAGLNGGPAVQFPSGAMATTSAGGNASFGGDFLVEYVAIEPTTTMQYDAVVTLPQANEVRFDILNNGGCDLIIVQGLSQIGDVMCTKTNLSGTSPHLFGFRRTNTASSPTFEVRIDGAASASGSSPLYGISLVGAGLYAGTFAEVVAISGPTTDTDLAALEGYLKGKYGL